MRYLLILLFVFVPLLSSSLNVDDADNVTNVVFDDLLGIVEDVYLDFCLYPEKGKDCLMAVKVSGFKATHVIFYKRYASGKLNFLAKRRLGVANEADITLKFNKVGYQNIIVIALCKELGIVALESVTFYVSPPADQLGQQDMRFNIRIINGDEEDEEEDEYGPLRFRYP